MNNLSHEQQAAKAEYLNKQLEQTLETYKAATRAERRAAIKHVDSFLATLEDDGQTFWLKFRERLERMNERPSMDIDTFNTIYLGGNSSPFPQ